MEGNSMNKDKLGRQLEMHEGKKLKSYICPGGYLTVGVGRNLEANPATGELGRKIDQVGMEITEEEAAMLLDNDIDRFSAEVKSDISDFDSLSEPRQHVLIDMAFNMGTQGLLKFKRMLAAIREQDFSRAADEMVDSRWARQVKSRSDRLARMMKENVDFEDVA
jgi:lysozyme